MSYVTTQPVLLAEAAGQLRGIGSAVSAANMIAAFPTTGLVPAAADEVSTMTAARFAAYGQAYQAIGAHASLIHEQFVGALDASANSYATTEAANATQTAGLLRGPAGAVRPAPGYSGHAGGYGGGYRGGYPGYGGGGYRGSSMPAASALTSETPVRGMPVAPAREVPAREVPVAPAREVPANQVPVHQAAAAASAHEAPAAAHPAPATTHEAPAPAHKEPAAPAYKAPSHKALASQ
jgi:hypothetical protein